jgi:hypothetical protein
MLILARNPTNVLAAGMAAVTNDDAVSVALEAQPSPFTFVSLTCSFIDGADCTVLACSSSSNAHGPSPTCSHGRPPCARVPMCLRSSPLLESRLDYTLVSPTPDPDHISVLVSFYFSRLGFFRPGSGRSIADSGRLNWSFNQLEN